MPSSTTKRKGDKSLVPDAPRQDPPQLLPENIHPTDELDGSAHPDGSWSGPDFLQQFDGWMTSGSAFNGTADNMPSNFIDVLTARVSNTPYASGMNRVILVDQEELLLEDWQSSRQELTDSTIAHKDDRSTDFSSDHGNDAQDGGMPISQGGDVPSHGGPNQPNHREDVFFAGGNSPRTYPSDLEIDLDTDSEWDDCSVPLPRV